MRSRENLENQEELRAKLEQIVRDVARKPDLIVRTELTPAEQYQERGKDLSKVWFRQSEHIDPRTGLLVPENVRIPEIIMDEDERVAMGIAAHEGGHSSISRMMEAGAGQYEGESGLMGLLMALEERPTDEEVRQWSEDGRKWIDLARFTELAKEIDHEGLEGKDDEKNKKYWKINKYQQLCNLLVYAREEESHKYDPEIIKLYQEIQPDVDFIESCLPDRTAPEKKRVEMATVRLQVAVRKIWPKVKDLYEEDKEENLLKNLLSQIVSGALSPGDKPVADLNHKQGGSSAVILELPPDLAAKLAKQLQTAQVDMSKAKRVKPSAELLDALRESLKHVPADIKKSMEEQAVNEMNKVEQELVDKLAPKLQERPRTALEIRKEMEDNRREHQERSELEAKAEQQKNIEREIQEESDRVRREQAALLEQKTVYDRVYDEVRPLEQALYAELAEIFHPKVKTKVRLKTSGTRINLPSFMRWDVASQAGQLPGRKYFESTERPDKKNYAVSLLVDLSSSMGGEKIEQTFRAVVVLVEALNRLGLNFELLGFQDELIVFKKFGEKVNDSLRRKISGMMDEVWDCNPGGHNNSRYNDDGPCLSETAAGLAKQPAHDRFLLVLSDGHPVGRRSNDYDLTEAVRKINAEGRVNLIGLGLGTGTEHVKEFYPVSLPNIQVKHLQEVLPELLKDIVQNPGKYKFRR